LKARDRSASNGFKEGDRAVQRIGILGGSFDPIHQGHLEIALCAKDQLKLDQIFFVPAARSPFKLEKNYAASDAARLEMTRLAVQEFPEFEVSALELERGGASYTVDTLKHFKQTYPQSEFYLLMGEDTYEGLDRWKSADEIRRMARIAVAPRIKSDSVRTKDTSPKAPIYLGMPLYDASSTELRADLSRLRQNQDAELAHLPKAVRQYIRQQGLYRQE